MSHFLAVGAYFTSQSPRKPLFQLSKLHIFQGNGTMGDKEQGKLIILFLFDNTVVLVILGGFMFFKWYRSGFIYPSGIVALASTAVFVINTILYFDSLKGQF